MSWSTFIPGVPEPQARHRFFRGSGRVYSPSSPWKGVVAGWVSLRPRELPLVPADAALSVTLDFALPRPASHFRTGKRGHLLRDDAPLWPIAGRKVGDNDNFEKAVYDACNGILWPDDKQIVHNETTKRYGTPTGCHLFYRIL